MNFFRIVAAFFWGMAFVFGGLALADRTVTYSTARAKVEQLELKALPDGGCAATAYGTVAQADGGPGYSSNTGTVELSGTAQARCLNVLSDGAALWRMREGL